MSFIKAHDRPVRGERRAIEKLAGSGEAAQNIISRVSALNQLLADGMIDRARWKTRVDAAAAEFVPKSSRARLIAAKLTHGLIKANETRIAQLAMLLKSLEPAPNLLERQMEAHSAEDFKRMFEAYSKNVDEFRAMYEAGKKNALF